jgi:hypothetical protein
MWYATRRIAHAVGWLIVLSIPQCLIAFLFATVLNPWYGANPESSEFVLPIVWLLLLPAVGFVMVMAIWRRWSLAWPLLVLFVLAWPFGVSVPIIVGLIGLGKLIVHAVGRGGATAASELCGAVVADAHPRGLVESVNNE